MSKRASPSQPLKRDPGSAAVAATRAADTTPGARMIKHSYSNGPIAAADRPESPPGFLLPKGASYYILPAASSSRCGGAQKTMTELRLTKPAPDFRGPAVINGDFKDISLSEYRGKYLVFFFYPLDFTFVCPTEIIAFSDRVEEFRAINCEVVACSTDSHFSHLAWVNTPRKQGGLGQMKIPLLADKNCTIAQRYGVYKEDDGIAFRGLFIIDDKGNLRQITVNDLPVGRSVDETLRLVQAFQFTDKHGEVCPAGWKPGKESMKPDPLQSKTFFQKNM